MDVSNLDLKDLATVITAVTSLVAAVGVILVKLQANKNTDKIEQTRNVLEENTAATFQTQQDVLTLKDTADATHSLVNGEHAEALNGWAKTAAKVAELTHDPRDKLMATEIANRRDTHQVAVKMAEDDKGG